MPTTVGFDDLTLASELRSAQRAVATLFPDIEVRRTFEPGVFTERPYALVTMLTITELGHSEYVTFPGLELNVAYYAEDHDSALVAANALHGFGRGAGRRMPLYDYDTDIDAPAETSYYLRVVGEVGCEIMQDLEDDRLYNVMASLTVETKRSLDKYSGELLTATNLTIP